MPRSNPSTNAAPPDVRDAGAPALRSTFADMPFAYRRGEFVELAIEALRMLEERRVAAVVVPGNPRALDCGGGHLRGVGQDQRVVATMCNERRHRHLVQRGPRFVDPRRPARDRLAYLLRHDDVVGEGDGEIVFRRLAKK